MMQTTYADTLQNTFNLTWHLKN